jgi:hypothetical protein
MRRTITTLVLLIFVLGVAVPSAASPLVGASANTIPQGTFMMDTWYLYRNFTRSYVDDLHGDNVGGWVDLPDSTSVVAVDFVPRVYYGVTDWLTLRVGVPLSYRGVDFDPAGSGDSSFGIGDIVIDPKMQVYRGEGGYPRLALLAGVQLPTGDAKADPPLSDGSTDFLAGFAVTNRMDDAEAHVCVTYWWNGEADNGANVKDMWIASASIENPLDAYWTLLWEAKAYVGETPDEYKRLYVCPGISWDNGCHFSIGLSAMVSVIADGGGGISWLDYEWAPYIRSYYRFF